MRFGIFSVVDHYPAELSRTTGQFYDELLEQAEAADQLGFESFWIAEHHFHEYGAIPRPAVWMAAAAQRTRKIRLGAAVVVLPFDNPLRVAEDYAMVDVISNGRLELGVGSGYLAHEFTGFGMRPEDKRERFDESLEILLRAWTGEKFSYDGRYHSIKDVAINVIPVQKPHPPVSIAVLRNEAAPHVGRKGFPLMLIPYASTEQISELSSVVHNYREEFAGSGKDATTARTRFGLHTHCAQSSQQARAEAKPAIDRYVRTRLYAKQRPFDTLLDKSLVAIGDPNDVVEIVKRYQQCGLTDFLAITNFGGMPHKQVLKSMELLATQVQPAFADHLAPAGATGSQF